MWRDNQRCGHEWDEISEGRRRLIVLSGVALSVIAGCTDTGDEAGEAGAGRAALVVGDATLSDTSITTDETLEVSGTIENEGEKEGTFHAELRMDGVIVDTQAVSVDAGESEIVSFAGLFSELDEYEVRINDVLAGTVDVSLPPPAFELVDTAISETTLAVGESVELHATIANTGGQEGSFDADLRIDGEDVDTAELTIAPDETESVVLTHSFDAPGSFEVGLNDIAVDTVRIERPATFEIGATSIGETTIRIGEEVEAAARIENVGEQPGIVRADLESGGEVLATREGPIEPGETATARFAVAFEERGRYVLSVTSAGPSSPSSRSPSEQRVTVGTVYVTECYVAVSETVTVGSGSASSYVFDLDERVDVRVAASVREGVEPTLTVDGPSEPIVDASDGPVDGWIRTTESGRHEIRFENESVLPWRSGRWTIEIEICTWA